MARQSHSHRKRYARTARGHDKAIASSIRSLDCIYAKAWQTLATISSFVHSVRSTKTRLSLSKPRSLDPYATKLPAPTSTTTLLQTLLHSTTRLISAPSNDQPTAPTTRTYQLLTSSI